MPDEAEGGGPHPDWLTAVQLLQDFGSSSRFLVLGMADIRVLKTDIHRVSDAAGKFISRSTWQLRQEPDIHYSQVFGGFRLWFHKDSGCYLPYPPPKEGQ